MPNDQDFGSADTIEACIDFAAIAAKSASTKSRGKGVKEEQLLPKVIQYDAVAAQPTTSPEEREAAPTRHASVEVVRWKAWCGHTPAMSPGEDTAYQAAITMVLRAHRLAGEELRQCVEICADNQTGKRWVRVEKAMEPRELRLFPHRDQDERVFGQQRSPFSRGLRGECC